MTDELRRLHLKAWKSDGLWHVRIVDVDGVTMLGWDGPAASDAERRIAQAAMFLAERQTLDEAIALAQT